MSGTDNHIEIARLQTEIAKKLNLTQDNLVFSYGANDGATQLDLITINPKHDQSFLYHTVSGSDKEAVLTQMLDYVTKNYRQESSYTVQWSKSGEGELHTSYFRAMDIYDVLEKFSHGREVKEYTIFSIILNPIA